MSRCNQGGQNWPGLAMFLDGTLGFAPGEQPSSPHAASGRRRVVWLLYYGNDVLGARWSSRFSVSVLEFTLQRVPQAR